MKILISTGVYPPEIGGPATYTKLMEECLPALGIEVQALPFSRVRRWPKGIRHILFFFRALRAAKGKSLLYAQDTVSVGLPTMLAAKVLRKKFLIRVPGDYAWEQSHQRFGAGESIDEFQGKRYGFRVEFLRFIQRFVLNRADAIITPSDYFKDLVSAWLKDPSKVRRIYNGVNLPEIKKEGSYKKKTLISAGRLVPWKGFDFLIRLMKELPGWELAIAGDGPQKEALEILIAEEGLEDRVKLLGRIKQSTLFKRIAESEIFVLNTGFESFSFQLVEVMHLGTPVVTTRIGNLSEIVEDGKEGFLLGVGDKEAFVRTIKKLSEDEALRERIVASAQEKAKQFSIERNVENTAKLIKKIA